MSALLSVRHYHQEIVCHEHDHAQLVFGLSGHLQFEVAGLGSRVSRQTLAVVPAGARHACESRNGSECLVFDVPAGDWLERNLGDHADLAAGYWRRRSGSNCRPTRADWSTGWPPARSTTR